MKLILIAALNKNRVIGRNGKIPWRIPEDLNRFKHITTNHAVLMGRKTFESIGKSLPNRRNIVISHNLQFSQDSIEVFASLPLALSALENEEKVFVIGGGEIFEQTIDRADELNLTIVENNEFGDVFFPVYEDRIGKTIILKDREDHNGFYYLSFEKK